MNHLDWKSSCIQPGASIRDAAEAINRSRLGIALILDQNGILQATVTDGDIRRAMLASAELRDPVLPFARDQFISVLPEVGRAEVLDVMQAHGISHIPILDKTGKLTGLHTIREIAGIEERPNIAVVMAGGRGTRLGEITKTIPKPMLKVAGRPILERLVLHLVGHGIKRIFLSVHYLGEIIESHFGDGSKLGCRIEYLREEEPLGTGGCLSLLPEKPEHDVLVCNGDLVTQVDFDAMLRFHEGGGYHATVGASPYTHTVPFGVLKRAGERLGSIEEKPVLAYEINAGVYVFRPEVVSGIPRKFFPITDAVSGLLEKKLPVGIFPIEDDWIDVGEQEQLLRARGHKPS